MLKIKPVRDGHGQLLGTTTTDTESGDVTARERGGRTLGHSSSTFNNTRGSSGRLVSTNTADVGLLFRQK